MAVEAPVTLQIDNGDTMPAICGLLATYDRTKGTLSMILKGRIPSTGGPAVDDDEVRALIMACTGFAYTDASGRGFDYRKYVRGLIRFFQVKSGESGFEFRRVEPAVSAASPFPEAASRCKCTVVHYMFKAAKVDSDNNVTAFAAAQLIQDEFNAAYRTYTEDDLKDIFPEAAQAPPAPAAEPMTHITTSGARAEALQAQAAPPPAQASPPVSVPSYAFGMPPPVPSHLSFGAQLPMGPSPYPFGMPYGSPYGMPFGAYPFHHHVMPPTMVPTASAVHRPMVVAVPPAPAATPTTELVSRKRGPSDKDSMMYGRRSAVDFGISAATSYVGTSQQKRPKVSGLPPSTTTVFDRSHCMQFVQAPPPPPPPPLEEEEEEEVIPPPPASTSHLEVAHRLSTFRLAKPKHDNLLDPSPFEDTWKIRNRRPKVDTTPPESSSDELVEQEEIGWGFDSPDKERRKPFRGSADNNNDKAEQSARVGIAIVAVFENCSETFAGIYFLVTLFLGVLYDIIVLLYLITEFMGLVFYFSTCGDPAIQRDAPADMKDALNMQRIGTATRNFETKRQGTMARMGGRFVVSKPLPPARPSLRR